MKKPARTFEQIGDESLAGRSNAPECASFKDFLVNHAKVLQRDGNTGPFSMTGRAPLEMIADWFDAILRNTLDGETITLDGVTFEPHKMKGFSLAIGGGAGFGKTIIELNLMAYCTAIRFVPFANYLPDREKLQEIVKLKFRPNVLDAYPWMSEMIHLGKSENASGKTVDRAESFTVTDGTRKSFGHFAGMHKPPTSIHFDICSLDEVDDIDDRNIGFVDSRMTGSKIHLTIFIGTQRIAGAGQNARLAASSYHVKLYDCPGCGKEWNLEENFPRIVRTRGSQEVLTAEAGHDPDADYYCGCPECGTELDRDGGRYVAKHPERIKAGKLGLRVSQFNVSAISLQEIVGSWFAAMADPSGEAMQAFHCDRLGIPNAGAAQPITQNVLDRAREQTAMSLTPGKSPRFAGLDTGPRCWFWCDEVPDALTSRLTWAEMIASGNAPSRVAFLMQQLNISCVFIDAGGEPDLTKRIVLNLNGLENFTPPVMPQTELLKSKMSFTGGMAWDGTQGRWRGIRAAAVLFVAKEAKGIVQTVGFTQEGKIYPLIKCNRAESIQTAVNDFLTPAEGMIELVDSGTAKVVRTETRARLPKTFIGPGASQAVLEGHLLNLRKERDVKTGEEDWIDGVENHLGLAKVYARLSATQAGQPQSMAGSFSADAIADLRKLNSPHGRPLQGVRTRREPLISRRERV